MFADFYPAPRVEGPGPRPWGAFVSLLACLFCAVPVTHSFASGRLQFENGEIVLRLDEGGHVLRRQALVGATLIMRHVPGMNHPELRIDEVTASANGAVALYRMVIPRPDGQTEDLCGPDPDGRRLALAMPDEAGGFRLTCSSGAEGKCILMGYRPWESRGEAALRDYHRACVHMFRADYGGDDHPTTRDGTAINFWDRAGIQKADMKDGMEFEAAWGPEGALCVAHPRVPENVTLDELALRYSRLSGRTGPIHCDQDTETTNPRALLFNRSSVAPRK